MSNRLIILSIIGAVIGIPLLLQGLLWWRVSSGVENAFNQLRQMTGNFIIISHSGTYAWIWGTAGINRLIIVPAIPGFFPNLQIEQLEVNFDNPLNLLSLARIGPDQPPPRQLDMRWRNLRLDSTELLNLGSDVSSLFLDFAPGCAGHQSVSGSDLINMGFDALQYDGRVRFNLNYRRGLLELAVNQTLRNAQQIDLKTVLSTDDLGGPVEVMASKDWRLAELSLRIDDVGYGERKQTFCLEREDMTEDAFLADQRQRSELGLRRAGLSLSTNLKTALLAEIPGFNLQINALPTAPIPLSNLLINSRSGLANTLNAEVFVNEERIQNANFGFDPILAMQASQQLEAQRIAAAQAAREAARRPMERLEPEETPSEVADETTPSSSSPTFRRGPSIEDMQLSAEERRQQAVLAAGFQVVPTSELHRYAGRQIRLRLVNNNRYDGVIEEVQGNTLRLQIRSGGQANIPIPLARISEALVNLRVDAQ